MSDKTKKGGGGSRSRPPQDRGPRRGPPAGDRAGGDKGGERPFRARPEGGAPRGDRPSRPFKPREDGDRSERPFRARPEGGAPRGDRPSRPFKPREEGERSERPFRARPDGGAPRGDRPSRPFKPREDGDRSERPFRARPEGGAPRGDRPSRPFRPREDGERSERPFRARSEAGDRPFRPRRDEGDRPQRPFRAREGGGDATARPRREDRQRSATVPASATPKTEYAERIAKVMARAGLCSRRDAETWIEAGRVTVNGAAITSPALDVTLADTITVDGQPLPTRERTRLFLYHKPRGLVTTARDPEGRETVFGALPAGLPRVVTVGRLDINTEGLLLLTNDGGLSRVLELPETGWLRRYRVRAFGDITQPALDALADGVTIDGMHYGPVEAEVNREQGDNVWLTLGLREGKNREVKKILEHLGLQVNRLIRLSFGPFQLGDIPEGAVEEVSSRILADQLGPELSAQAGADFEAPVFVYDEDDFRPKKREDRAPEDRPRPDRSREDRPRPERRERDDSRGERPQRAGRFAREDGPPRRDRDGDAPRGRDRDAGDAPRKPPRRHPTEVVRSVWRAEPAADAAPPAKRAPRRGADPKAARTESAEREHIRSGKVQSRSGKSVLVERIARDPAARIREEMPARKPRRDDDRPAREERPRRSAWDEGTDRPARPARAEEGERPRRSFRDAGDERPRRPRADRPDGDRPRGDRPRSDRPPGDRPQGDRPQGDRPPRRDFGAPRGDAPSGERPFRSPPKNGRPGGGRPEGGKPFGSKPFGGRPGGGGGGRPGGGKPGGGRPGGSAPRRPRRDD